MIDVAAAERTVLGSMLTGAIGLASGRAVATADFSLSAHQVIHARIMAMDAAGLSVDVVTLLQELQQAKQVDSVGGWAYVDGLTDGIPSHGNPEGWARVVRREAARRRQRASLELAIAKLDDGEAPEDVAGEVLSGLTASQLESAEVRPVHISAWVMPTLQELEDERSRSNAVLGIATGIPDFDEVTTGWRSGELTYVGAIPGRGKTAFLLQCAYAAAMDGVGVGVISLEMRATQLMRRLTVRHSTLSSKKLRDPRLMSLPEWQQAKASVLSLGDLPVWGTDVSGLRPAQIANTARQMYESGARIVFVDFVQIIREDGKDRREAINRVSATLRDTAKQLNIPFVVASQLARRDADENRRPTMQDLRESGNLEQDAHRVVLIYRPKDKEGEWTGEDQLIIAKAREGCDGHVEVTYDSASLTFAPRQHLQQSQPTPISAARTRGSR